MSIVIVLLIIWAGLMLRSGVVEYKYYQSVKLLEPDIWQKLGSPKFIKIPFVFVSSTGKKLLQDISNKTVCELARKHQQAKIHFLLYVVLALAVSIVYFKVVI